MQDKLDFSESAIRIAANGADMLDRMIQLGREVMRSKGYQVGSLAGGAYQGWAGEKFTMALSADDMKIIVQTSDYRNFERCIREFRDMINQLPDKHAFGATIGLNPDGSFMDDGQEG